MKVIQVVKRYGICGGMEEYAYRLSNELSKLGIDISVVCERKINDPLNTDFAIYELGETRKKPRWWSHLQFAQKVKEWVRDQGMSNTLIHSHERVDCHNITTIHSTLFNFQRKIVLPSLRVFMNQRIERKEILSPTVKAVVPVSEVISQQLNAKYPSCSRNLKPPISPGVSDLKIKDKSFAPEEPVIGFIGKEWDRKGLPKVIRIWRRLLKVFPNTRLCLAGFPKEELIPLKDSERKYVDVLGYIKKKEEFYERIDLLLHPAKKEAYGMVIAEAMSLRIPVLCSSQCGASNDVQNDRGKILDCNAPDSIWVESLIHILKAKSPEVHFQRSWRAVSLQYVKLYKELESFSKCE